MTARIVKATVEHAEQLSELGRIAWVAAHGESAAPEHIDCYVAQKYSTPAILNALNDPANQYNLIYCDGQLAGYSNLIINATDPNIAPPHVAELDRIYLLDAYYGRRLGLALLRFNMELARQNAQNGLWLYVWKGNDRAISFYTRAGFKIAGSHDFKISETHSNPNHLMFLAL